MTPAIFVLKADDSDFTRLVEKVCAQLELDGEIHHPNDVRRALEYWIVEAYEQILADGVQWLFGPHTTIAQDVFYDRLGEHEPDVDDSLPPWAEWYSNYSDYLVHEYPEFVSVSTRHAEP